MIGSARKVRGVFARLREEGVSEERLRKVHAPIGLEIGAITPEEIAVSILAEMTAVRRSAAGKGLPSDAVPSASAREDREEAGS